MWMDMTKLTAAFRNFLNAPEKYIFQGWSGWSWPWLFNPI